MAIKPIPIREQLATDIKRLTHLTMGNCVTGERRERFLDALHTKKVQLERIRTST
jgi:hypothetical protein